MNRSTSQRIWWQNPVFGWLTSCALGTAVVVVFLVNKRFLAAHPGVLFEMFGGIILYSLMPVFMAVIICERYAVRSPIWYIVIGSTITLGIPSAMVPSAFGFFWSSAGLYLSLSGAAMGLMYWLISGRFSGLEFRYS